MPFEGTAERPSVTLGTDGGSKNGLLALPGIHMNCRFKHYSEALPGRQVLKMHSRLKMLEQRMDDRNCVRHISFTKAQSCGRN